MSVHNEGSLLRQWGWGLNWGVLCLVVFLSGRGWLRGAGVTKNFAAVTPGWFPFIFHINGDGVRGKGAVNLITVHKGERGIYLHTHPSIL